MSKKMFVAIIAFLASTFAFANPSVYIGGDLGTTSYTANSGSSSTTQSGDMGFGGFIGLGLSSHFAIEGDYTHYGQSSNSDFQISSMGVMLKAVAPINSEFHLFGKLGVVNLTATGGGASDSSSGLGYALGLDLRINGPLFLFGQYESTFVDVTSADVKPSMWALGLQYNF